MSTTIMFTASPVEVKCKRSQKVRLTDAPVGLLARKALSWKGALTARVLVAVSVMR